MHAAAEAGSRDRFSAWLAASLAQLAGNDPGIVPLMAALAGLGKLAAEGEVTHLATLRQDANDHR